MEITRWSETFEPTEEELRARMAAEHLSPYIWSAEPGYHFGIHRHDYTKVLYCVRGDIRFTVPDEESFVDLDPGDRMVLPLGTRHAAVVGATGATCLEAHRSP